MPGPQWRCTDMSNVHKIYYWPHKFLQKWKTFSKKTCIFFTEIFSRKVNHVYYNCMQARAERPSIKGLKQIGSYKVCVRKVRFPNQHFQVIWRIWLRRAWLQSCKFLGLGNRSRIRCGSRRRLPSVPVILAPESWIINSLLLSSSTSQFISGSRVLQCKSQERIGRHF